MKRTSAPSGRCTDAGAQPYRLERPDQKAELARVSCPTLIVAGADDKMYPPHGVSSGSPGMVRQVGSRRA
jgi:pimeloyl-ACP methyl ester carboxylesterase